MAIVTNDAESSPQSSDSRANSEPMTIWHPGHIIQRLIALLLMCLIGFGSYFCYDNPGALQDNFTKDMSLSTSKFVLLYSWYAWPNVILCFIGGFLIDRVFGIRLGTCIYALFVVLGQLIFASGAYLNSFNLTIFGRFLFGIGGESLAVAQNNYAVLWFKGKELNMVFGFQLSFARLGSSINFVLMEPLYMYVGNHYKGYQCLGITLFIASATCFASFTSAVLLAMQDKRAERLLKRRGENGEEERIVKLTDVRYFPPTFWLTTVVIIFYYCVIFSFVALGKVFFERKFGLEPHTANLVNSILYIISSVLSPFLGILIDKMGRNVFWVFISLIFTVVGHLLLALTFVNPFISMSLIGISYSMIASALWPLIALVIPEYQLGTAYGIAQSFQNLGLATFTIFSGVIVDSYGYFMLEVFFIACLCLASLATIAIWVYDSNHTNILNMTTEERQIYEEMRKAENNERCGEHSRLMEDSATSDEVYKSAISSCQSSSDKGETSKSDIVSKSPWMKKESEVRKENSPPPSSSWRGGENGGVVVAEKRKKFGTRFLAEKSDVFAHNAWDDVRWDANQEKEAAAIVSRQMEGKMPREALEELERTAGNKWDEFYVVHGDRFFKDRHWLFTEFPELKLEDGASILEIGCGVGNTVFPLLRYNEGKNVRVFACDFSEKAVSILKSNLRDSRCEAFVHDVTSSWDDFPVEENSLDIFVAIYVLSAVNPDKMESVLTNARRFLKPGGLFLFRDYGRYDMSQLRFKRGRCAGDNFYARGEGTLVYFFDKEEVSRMFKKCGFIQIENHCDKRLQVNRRKQLKMYRVWIQGKFQKPRD